MANKHLLHLRNNAKDSGSNPVAPNASSLEYGEIAINYAAGKETLYIKNDDDEIIPLSFSGSSNVDITSEDGSVEIVKDGDTFDLAVKVSAATSTHITSEDGSVDITKSGDTFDLSVVTTPDAITSITSSDGMLSISTVSANTVDITVPDAITSITSSDGIISATVVSANTVDIVMPSVITSVTSSDGLIEVSATSANTIDITVPDMITAITSKDKTVEISAISANTIDLSVPEARITSAYDLVTYDMAFSADTIEVGDTHEEAINKAESATSKLVDEVIKDERVTEKAIEKLALAAGTLSGDVINYLPYKDVMYISGATSLTEADILLNNGVITLENELINDEVTLGSAYTGLDDRVYILEHAKSDLDDHLSSASTKGVENQAITKEIIDDEYVAYETFHQIQQSVGLQSDYTYLVDPNRALLSATTNIVEGLVNVAKEVEQSLALYGFTSITTSSVHTTVPSSLNLVEINASVSTELQIESLVNLSQGITIIVNNTSASDITITLPTSVNYTCKYVNCSQTVTISANDTKCFKLLSTNNYTYIILV